MPEEQQRDAEQQPAEPRVIPQKGDERAAVLTLCTVLRKRVGIAAAAQAELDGEQRGAAEQAEHQPCDRQRCRAEAACEYAEHGGYGGERQRADAARETVVYMYAAQLHEVIQLRVDRIYADLNRYI